MYFLYINGYFTDENVKIRKGLIVVVPAGGPKCVVPGPKCVVTGAEKCRTCIWPKTAVRVCYNRVCNALHFDFNQFNSDFDIIYCNLDIIYCMVSIGVNRSTGKHNL